MRRRRRLARHAHREAVRFVRPLHDPLQAGDVLVAVVELFLEPPAVPGFCEAGLHRGEPAIEIRTGLDEPAIDLGEAAVDIDPDLGEAAVETQVEKRSTATGIPSEVNWSVTKPTTTPTSTAGSIVGMPQPAARRVPAITPLRRRASGSRRGHGLTCCGSRACSAAARTGRAPADAGPGAPSWTS